MAELTSSQTVSVKPSMRHPRLFLPDHCYHVTVRCNNREFRLVRPDCREVLLYAIQRCQEKYGFKLYGICVMSNHVHYLIEPAVAQSMPQIMHWLNWYSAMCFNRMLNRTGHFWEKRYHATGFPNTDIRRALNTLRYIHANPKVAGMQRGFFYDFSNYGSYERLTDDGLTQWHPAFLALGETLEQCAAAYRQFCERYQPPPKRETRSYWGSKLLAKIKARGKPQKVSPGQQSLWEDWDAPVEEIKRVAEKFVAANQFPPHPK
jgi:putative transposase